MAAGELAAQRRAGVVTVAATKSTELDVVTEADHAAERLIRDELARARPQDGILGEEEGGGVTGSTGLHWIVDPIDGTVNFLYGIPHYAVSIAVVEGDPDPLTWTALAGCVVNPALGEVFTAAAGGGAFLNDRPIAAAAPVPLERALIGTGFSYDSTTRARQGAVAGRLLPRIRDLRRAGAASLDLCAVAAGRLNGYYEQGLGPWDYAAGSLVCQEAGAVARGVGGGAPDHRLVLAAEPQLAENLANALAEAGL